METTNVTTIAVGDCPGSIGSRDRGSKHVIDGDSRDREPCSSWNSRGVIC
jgi:hypothetical protein